MFHVFSGEKMKSFCLFGFICVLLLYGLSVTQVHAAFAYNYKKDLNIIRKCNETSGLSLVDLNLVLMKHEIAGITSKELKCFLHCVYTQYNWMDSVGGFYEDNIKNDLNDSTLRKHSIEWLVYRCTSTDSKNKCDRAYDFTYCFWKEAKKNHEHTDMWDS